MSLPIGATYSAPVPHGRTARRLTWEFLPPGLRQQIEQRLGSPVASHASQDAGFTPGFASLLTGTDGSQVFVKAASRVAQAPFAAAYAEEGRKLRLLDGVVPAPRLLWSLDDEWVVLGIEAVPHHRPQRPWVEDELVRALDAVEEIADRTTEVPAGLRLTRVYDDQPQLLTGWQTVAALEPDWPHLTESAALARSLSDVPADRFVHADLRDDNILLADDGRTLVCDWNWPGLGPAWLDLVTLLVIAHGDGIDAEAHLAARALTRDVPPEHVDAWLAAIAGFMMEMRERPSPSSSPYLQTHTFWT
ncbi:MAG: hypothetical protein EOO74_09480, partial [Myxococcales bacterium]